VLTGDCRGWLRTAGDCRRRLVTVRDGGGLQGTAGDGTSEARKEATEALEKTQALTHEVTILRPLKGTAIDIRQHFFATYRRREDALKIDDPYIIDSGNLRAHTDDVILDVYLLRIT